MKELFIYSFLTACFSSFLDYCMLEDEIFGFYRKWLNTFKCKFLLKPFGDCTICMNGWISIGTFFFTGLSIIWLIPYVSVSYVFLQIISRIES